MVKKLFKIYDGRTNFWQWDTKQKLIVLDDKISEVRFTHKDDRKSKRGLVYTKDEMLICDVPDSVLQKPKNLIVYGCINDNDGTSTTIGMSKIAVLKQEMPESYVPEDEETKEDILTKLAILETQIRDVEKKSEIKKFETRSNAEEWATTNQLKGVIVLVKKKEKWIACVVNNDYTVSPVCNSDDEMIIVNFDGGSSFSIDSNSEKESE